MPTYLLTNLKIIGRAEVGVDNVDVKVATRHGIAVVNSPEGKSTQLTGQ